MLKDFIINQIGFFSGIANFGSKILGNKNVTKLVAPALHKVYSTISERVSMIHPANGSALGEGTNLAYIVDRIMNKC